MSVFVDINGTRVELWAGSGPFTARSAADDTDDWPYWFVTDNGRRNIMRFPDKPGAVFTDRASAQAIAAAANAKSPRHPEG